MSTIFASGRHALTQTHDTAAQLSQGPSHETACTHPSVAADPFGASEESPSPPIASAGLGMRRSWQDAHPVTPRLFQCRCGQSLFFQNWQCLQCGAGLGYDPELGKLQVLELEPDGQLGTVAPDQSYMRYRRCANFEQAPRCNWLIQSDIDTANALCRCCRLNRIVPDPSIASNALLWRRTEVAKRRLVSSLLTLGLPVESRLTEDPERGLAFDLMVGGQGLPAVTTGHLNGIITIDVAEADDGFREAVRTAMGEPYRTVLGHLRHESGHYYWFRLIEGSEWLAAFRSLFGDERQDYGQALLAHHDDGPSADWPDSFVSAYASAHPWEDWAETWAHYLHMLDTLDTALSAGMDSGHANLLQDQFDEDVLYPSTGDSIAQGRNFLSFVNGWVELTAMLNELSRSMGLPDFYPFVLSKAAVTKLHFVHTFLQDLRRQLPETSVTDQGEPAASSTDQ